MSYEQYGFVGLVEDLQQLFLHHNLGLRIECGKWFIHQKDWPLHDQGARQRYALAHAPRQLAWQMALEAAQAKRGNEHIRALITFGARNAAHFEPEADIVDDVAPGKKIQILPDHD